GPHPRLVEHFGAVRDRRVEERADRGAVVGRERDVTFTTLTTGCMPGDPEVGLHPDAEPAVGAEIHDPAAAERREHRIVEREARGVVVALDREVVEHAGGFYAAALGLRASRSSGTARSRTG